MSIDDDNKWKWCAGCQKAYKSGDEKILLGGERICPHSSCGMEASFSWDWEEFQKTHKQFPTIPTAGEIYIIREETNITMCSRESKWPKE